MSVSVATLLQGIIDQTVPRAFTFAAPTKALTVPIGVVRQEDRKKAREEDDETNDDMMRELGEMETKLAKEKAETMLRGSRLTGAAERQPLVRVPLDDRWERKKAKRAGLVPQTAGRKWFDLPATPITPEILAHLKLQHMRSLLDTTKSWYKQSKKKFVPPTFFELGTVIPGPTEHYTAPPKRTRGRLLVDAVLADSELRRSIRGRFAAMVTSKHDHRKFRGRMALARKKRKFSRR